jgi:RNA polymerase sigma-70 factor (ECF subfamily)
MRRIATGDKDALGELYERHRPGLLRFFAHLSRDPVHAEDGVQETFLRVWRAAPRYEPRARFTTWLFQIAKNLWLTERDKRKRRPALGVDGPPRGADDDAPSSGGPADAELGPRDTASQNELHAAVRAAVDRLPEGQRLVVVLADFQGLPYREVAEILDIPVGTVKSRRFAADKRLREALKNLGRTASELNRDDAGDEGAAR